MFKKYKPVKAAVTGIIIKNSKIYLTKRSRFIPEGGKWCFPGGHIKRWETAEKAIKREIKEETGFDVKKTKLLFYFDEIIPRINVHNILLIFKVEVSGKEKLNIEVSKSGWFTKKEINKLNLAFRYKDVIKRFFKERKTSK